MGYTGHCYYVRALNTQMSAQNKDFSFHGPVCCSSPRYKFPKEFESCFPPKLHKYSPAT